MLGLVKKKKKKKCLRDVKGRKKKAVSSQEGGCDGGMSVGTSGRAEARMTIKLWKVKHNGQENSEKTAEDEGYLGKKTHNSSWFQRYIWS